MRKYLLLLITLFYLPAYAIKISVVNNAEGYGVIVKEIYTYDTKSDIPQNPSYVNSQGEKFSWEIHANEQGHFYDMLEISVRDLKNNSNKVIPVANLTYEGVALNTMLSDFNLVYFADSPTDLIADTDFDDDLASDDFNGLIIKVRKYDPETD